MTASRRGRGERLSTSSLSCRLAARRIEEMARSGSAGGIEEPLARLGAELDELVAAMTALVQAGK